MFQNEIEFSVPRKVLTSHLVAGEYSFFVGHETKVSRIFSFLMIKKIGNHKNAEKNEIVVETSF